MSDRNDRIAELAEAINPADPQSVVGTAARVYDRFVAPLREEDERQSRLERALALEPPEGWRRVRAGSMDIVPAGDGEAMHTLYRDGDRLRFSHYVQPEVALFMARQALILRDGVDPLEPHDLTQVPAGATVRVSVAKEPAPRVQHRSREDVRITGTHTLPAEQFDGIVEATVNRGAIVYRLDEHTERENILAPVSGGWVLFYRGADGLRDSTPSDDRFPADWKDRAMTGQSFDNGVRVIEVTGCANCPLLGEVPGGRLCWPTGEWVDGAYKTCGQDGERTMRIPSLAADFRLSLCPLERRDITLRLARTERTDA